MNDPAAELERVQTRYRIRFAGHPRVSRDPEELEELIAELDALAATDEALAARVAEERALFCKELDAIRVAVAIPYAVPAARLRMWTDLQLHRYQRSFAAQDRRTRDVALLDEIREDLRGLRGRMTELHALAPEQGLDRAAASVDRSLERYDAEVDAIRRARRTGPPAEQGSRLAALANAQFDLYQEGFAGQSRLSRHPSTLVRVVQALEEIRRSMQSLALDGFRDESNARNIGIVEQRIQQYRREVEQIHAARAGAAVAERVTALGRAANDVFAAYRADFAGQSRETRDESLLARLAERLVRVAKEMDALDRDHGDDTNARNLRLVTDNLVLYAREFDAIRSVKADRT